MSSAGKVHISLWHQQTNDMPFPPALLSCLYKNTLSNQEGNPKRKAMCGRKDTVHGAEKDKDKSRFVSRPNTAIINNVFLFFFVHPLVFITHLTYALSSTTRLSCRNYFFIYGNNLHNKLNAFWGFWEPTWDSLRSLLYSPLFSWIAFTVSNLYRLGEKLLN